MNEQPDVCYIVGQDADGRWLAVEAHGLGGGLFCDRAAAIRFAETETGHRPGAVRFASQTLSLEFRPEMLEAMRAA